MFRSSSPAGSMETVMVSGGSENVEFALPPDTITVSIEPAGEEAVSYTHLNTIKAGLA